MASVNYKLKKGDTVVVSTGKDSGKKGEILKVIGDSERVLVEKVNLVKRHLRQSSQGEGGGIVEKEAPIHISNVRYLCPKCDAGVKISMKILKDGKKVRSCGKCGEIFDK